MSSAVCSINAAEVFAEHLRSELNSYTYQPILEGTDEFSALKTLYDDFLKNGNLEKFYSKYYATVPLKSTRFFCGLSRNAATLIADSLIAFCKKQRESPGTINSTTALKEREMAGLQYLGGYVLHNLHKKHASTFFSFSIKGRVHGSAHVLESKYFFAFARYDPILFNLICCL